jgi:hypothetical protein
MLDRLKAQKALRRHFDRHLVADLPGLQNILGTTSRATVFRVLSQLGYWTSYSHAGRYYTLEAVPRFDELGLWAHGEILFSKYRTLRATVVHFTNVAPAGQTHAELQSRLRLRVHDTLHDLVEDKEIGRAAIEDLYVYVSSQRNRGRRQIIARRKLLQQRPRHGSLPSRDATIDVLLAFIRHPREDPVTLASLLELEGKHLSASEIHAVFETYGLGKKKRPRGAGRRETRAPPP